MISPPKTEAGKRKARIYHENTRYTPPIYPLVNIPVPDVDLEKLSRKISSWYVRLLVYIVAKVLQE